jgi:hypothetical protein
MSTIDQMWQKFAEHQPVADRLGYGEAWRRMCEERTEEAMYAAYAAAWVPARAIDAAAAAASASSAVDAAYAAGRVAWAKRAIEYIEKAEGAA